MAIIEVNNISKAYGNVQALKQVSLSLEKGNIYGFIGPNGAGKTTLIRVLLGLIKADEGDAKVFNEDAWQDAVSIHQNVAYVPGDVNLWPNITGGEAIDILMGLKSSKNGKKKEALYEQFDFNPRKKCRSYSKGNRQKVALIAALASDVDLFILDEPTSGLDPLMEKVFQENILRLKEEGKTVFLSSHILSEVEKLCNHVFIIKEGQIIEEGKLEDLRHLTRNQIHIKSDYDLSFLKTLKGVHEFNHEDNIYRFQIETEALNPLIKKLADYNMKSFESTPPTLDELFMRHYKKD